MGPSKYTEKKRGWCCLRSGKQLICTLSCEICVNLRVWACLRKQSTTLIRVNSPVYSSGSLLSIHYRTGDSRLNSCLQNSPSEEVANSINKALVFRPCSTAFSLNLSLNTKNSKSQPATVSMLLEHCFRRILNQGAFIDNGWVLSYSKIQIVLGKNKQFDLLW